MGKPVKFKVGDKVVCVDATGFGHRLKEGQEYIVTELFFSGSIRVDGEPTHTYIDNRFEKVTELSGWKSI